MKPNTYSQIRSLRESTGESYYGLMSYKYERIAVKELVQKKLQEAKHLGVSIYELDARTQYNLALKKYDIISKNRPYMSHYSSDDEDTFKLSIGDLLDIRRKVHDFEQWYEWRTYDNGGRYKLLGKPKPYCSEYFQYFLREIMRLEWGNIGNWLNDNFIGDIIDRDYIEGLLSCAEVDYELDKKHACVVFQQDTIAGYILEKGFAALSIDGASSTNVILGGNNYCRRANMIREIIKSWNHLDINKPITELICKDFESYTFELEQSMEWNENYSHLSKLTAITHSIEPQTEDNQVEEFQSSATYPDELPEKVIKSIRGGQQTDRVAISPDALDSELSGMKTKHCDTLAKSILLCPPDDDYTYLTDGHARIWALVDAIKDRECASGSARQLAKMLGSRYGYTVGEKLTKKDGNPTYQRRFKYVVSAIDKMRESEDF